MFRYLIFNGLKFQLDSICLSFAPHDITVIMWFWLVVDPPGGGESYVISHSSGGEQQPNSIL